MKTSLASLAVLGLFCPGALAQVTISEIRTDQPGADIDEYFELAGASGTSLDNLFYIVIGDSGADVGIVESITNLTGLTIPVSQYFVAAEATFTLGVADLTSTLNFENTDNVTHLLVQGFFASDGDDLDFDDDGVLDITPWTSILDCVALLDDGSGGDAIYCATTVGPDGAGAPGHVFRCSPGWNVGAFDPLGGVDTPGAANGCAPPVVRISEIRTDQPGGDVDEYFELTGAPGAQLLDLSYVVIGDGGGGAGTVEEVISLSGFAIPGSGFFVAAEATFTLGSADLVTTLNFENTDNVTHMLVLGFSGTNGMDLDTDDDGNLDLMPWTAVLDCVGIQLDVTGGDPIYCATTVGPDGSFAPGHAYFCDANPLGPGVWIYGLFDPVGGLDTPGAASSCDEFLFCFGNDQQCPCTNGGGTDSGCDNAQSTGGVRLTVPVFAPDGLGGGTASLVGTGFNPAAAPAAIVLRSRFLEPSPVLFGDGMRCLSTQGLIRLAARLAMNGFSVHPISHGAGFGTFYYQLWYRNTPASYCTPSAFNVSNAASLTWP